jgi:hypothetical protein
MFSKAALGISMNLITIRSPSRVCWSDACPFGLGGYSATGRAWRIRIPASSPIFGNPTVNNLLKFLGMAINIWLVLELEIKHKHGGFNINYEKATVVWQQFGFGSQS